MKQIKLNISLLVFVLSLIVINSCNDEGQGPLEGSGNITFYFNDPMPCDKLEITFVNPKTGSEAKASIDGDKVFSGTPECSEVPSISFMNRFYGEYSYSVVCGSYSFGNTLTLNTPCHLIKLEPPK